MEQGNRKRRGRPLLIAAVGVAAISYVQGAVAAASDASTQADPAVAPAEPVSLQQHPVGNLRPPPPPPDGGSRP